jgi:hypothetical protein
MTGEVLELKSIITADPEVIEFLERALIDAKEGKTTAVLIMEQNKEGALSYAIAGVKDRFKTLGFLSHAIYKLQSDET